ncbi:DUF3945 domain-containing protein [Elizabethkingia meningoseptica]|uniref:DUF3945 domain-containing protein n=1 Tax=Elizabethkingia meningoseptica TaxID=238 RepID=UPI0022F17B5C|nr:DUF3945 domain-containing protein [Elizabethkingia meningoseptica]EJK5328101.1 DUF3945 domain-containing protein [Elizabethkingia meningoseptica]WBS74136.1 DUF3945 domain-containing protein [Elizabethkingia meningoseptica]
MNNTINNTSISEANTLLVLHLSNNSVGMVQNVSQNGHLIDVTPDSAGVDSMIRIDSSAESFTEFYADFYNQLKNPEAYSFFKVTEFEAVETALGLQDYIDSSSSIDREDLKQYEVSIDAVEILRNKKKLKSDSSNNSNSYSKKPSADVINPRYRYQIEDVDWNALAKIGLEREMLEKFNVLDELLKGFKTSVLLPVRYDDGEEGGTVNARLQLKLNDNGEVVLHIHQSQKMPDFRKKFLGHKFSKEDRLNLLNIGNMGRVVKLVNPVTGEVIPSLISRDKLTNELFSLPTDFIRIPAVVCGVVLSSEQQEVLRSGKPLFVENMLSKSKRLFNATLQFNAEKQWLEFFFNKKLKGNNEHSFEFVVPSTFRGMKLCRWQIEKLKTGEMVYISRLVSEKGRGYQGYIRFDEEVGRIVFSFKKPTR